MSSIMHSNSTVAPLEAFQDTPPASPHAEAGSLLSGRAAVLRDMVPSQPGSRTGTAPLPIDILPGIVAVTLPFVRLLAYIPVVLTKKVVQHQGENDGQKDADEESAEVTERLPEQVRES